MASTARPSLRAGNPDHFVGDTFRLGTCAFNASVSCGKRASDSCTAGNHFKLLGRCGNRIQWCKNHGAKNENIKTLPAKRNEQDQKQLIVPLADSLKPGTYTVDWHVVSVDGHKTKGHYTFSVK